jgi:hypothetical protein
VLARKHLSQRVREVLEQMKAIRDLNGIRGSLPSALRVGAAAVTSNDLDAGMRLQPVGQCLGPPIGEQVDHAAALEVHQDRAILLAFALGPVVHPEHARHDGARRCALLQPAQERIAAGAHSQSGGQPRPRGSTQFVGHGFQRLGEAVRAPGVRLKHPGQPLGEDAAGAVPGVAVEAASVKL